MSEPVTYVVYGNDGTEYVITEARARIEDRGWAFYRDGEVVGFFNPMACVGFSLEEDES